MRIFWNFIAAIFGGLLIAVMATMVTTMAGFHAEGSLSSGAFWVGLLAGVVMAAMSPRAAKAWRHILMTCGGLAATIPFVTAIFTGGFFLKNSALGPGPALGSAMGGIMALVISVIVGGSIAAFFILIGRRIGKDPSER